MDSENILKIVKADLQLKLKRIWHNGTSAHKRHITYNSSVDKGHWAAIEPTEK